MRSTSPWTIYCMSNVRQSKPTKEERMRKNESLLFWRIFLVRFCVLTQNYQTRCIIGALAFGNEQYGTFMGQVIIPWNPANG